MNEQELIVIENQLTNGNKHSICNEMVYSLILALREERAKSAELEKTLRLIANPIHKTHWQVVYPGQLDCHCSICRKIRHLLIDKSQAIKEDSK